MICFHGAVNRETREIPAFIPFLPNVDQYAHQLLISDPSMMLDGEFSMSWYAGDSAFESQKVLPDFFQAICDFLEIDRTIYLGTSGGGFGALYYAWHHPGSVVIAGNPQTRIQDYYAGHVERYRSACWPDIADIKAMEDTICTDVRKLYAERFENLVIYVQANSDAFHLLNHMAPFMSAVAHHKGKNLICNLDYWGKIGHSPTFEAFQPWLQAVLSTPDLTVENVIKSKAAFQVQPYAAPAPKQDGQPRKFDSIDVQKSDIIRNWLLQS